MSTEAFNDYKQCLDKLHELELINKCCDQNDICDIMDEAWKKMSVEEKAKCNQYSIELWEKYDKIMKEMKQNDPQMY